MSPRRRVAAAALLALVLVASGAGCGSPEPEGRRYELDGVVRGVDLEADTPRLTLQHEAIDDFVGIEGRVEPMAAMTMTMAVWEGATLPEGLATGQAVRFVLDVDWDRSPTALIVSLERRTGS